MIRFKRNDIVMTVPPYRPQVFVILEVNPDKPKNCYTALCPVKGKRFVLSDGPLKKIGVADPDFLAAPGGDESQSTANALTFERGKQRAEREMLIASQQGAKERWALLAKANPGDLIDCNIRGTRQRVKFMNVLAGKAHKYVWTGENHNGTVYRYPLAVIVVAGAPGMARTLEEAVNAMDAEDDDFDGEDSFLDEED